MRTSTAKVAISVLLYLALLAGTPWSTARGEDAAPAKPVEPANPPEAAPAPEPATLPFVTIDREKGHVDVEAVVCLDEGVLELAVTTKMGKEHEAVFAMKGKAQHVHLALLTLGGESGEPGKWTYKDNVALPVAAKGSPVALTVIYQKDGKTLENPVNHFVREIKTKEQLPSNIFVFAGSRVIEREDGSRAYGADLTGDVVSLVTFETEMLAMSRAASADNDSLSWEANPDATPDVGTAVTLRFKPVPKDPAAAPAGPAKPAAPAP